MKLRSLKGLLGALALLSLAACLVFPVLYFLGRISEGGYKTGFLIASIGWFVFATWRRLVPGIPAGREPMA